MPKAIICSQPTGLNSLEFGELAISDPADHEVLIKVAYAGVNYPDTLIIQGKYQFVPDGPFAPGQEVSGEVIKVGKGVEHVVEGDIVIASMTWGGYSEVTKAHADNVYLLPPGISMEKGAVILETFGTVIHALRDRGGVKAGETMAILGASGGIGSAAIQLGKIFGIQTVAVCSTEEKRKEALSNGANIAIGYDNLKTSLKQFDVDVVLDPVGGEMAEQAFRSLRSGGRHLVVGFASGKIPSIPLNLPLLKSASIVGVFWGSFWRENPLANRSNILMVLKWIAQNKVDVPLGKIYPLREAAVALEDLMERRAIGKSVLKVS